MSCFHKRFGCWERFLPNNGQSVDESFLQKVEVAAETRTDGERSLFGESLRDSAKAKVARQELPWVLSGCSGKVQQSQSYRWDCSGLIKTNS